MGRGIRLRPANTWEGTMRHSVRLTVCGLLAAGSFSLAVALPGGIASAGVPKVTCSSLTGSETAQNLSGCTPTTNIGAAGTGAISNISETLNGPMTKFTGTATVTWANGNAYTETFKGTIAYGTKDKCPATVGGAGSTQVAEIKQTGKLAGTGPLNKGKTKGTDCAYEPSGGGIDVVNFPGTVVDF
jgi:hypothetical protein